MRKFYRIAGLNVEMDSFGRTADQAKVYECEKFDKVDIMVHSLWEVNKNQYPYLSDDDGEYLATGSDFYKKLLRYDGFMLHSSAVVADGKAYLFTADSGTGKSTHTSLWKKLFGNRAYILNDDKPALRLEDGIWYVYGTPWSGKHDLSMNERVPLSGIAIIERGEENRMERMKEISAIVPIIRQANRPKDIESRECLLRLIDKLLVKVPIWKLTCNMTLDAAILSYETMSGNKWRSLNE